MFGQVLLGVVGDFADHVVGADVEVDVTRILTAMWRAFRTMLARLLSMVPLRTASIICMMAADGFGVFNQSYGVDFGVDTSLYALDHSGVEIAKVFLRERGGTAARVRDLDVGAATRGRYEFAKGAGL
jgi:hypothetical protein